MGLYVIKKKLNNNVIMVRDLNQNDMILIGTGIGFKAHINSVFKDLEKVQQCFILKDKNNKENLRTIVDNYDHNLIALIEEEIGFIQSKFTTPLNENIHITLIDHLIFAIDRQKRKLEFKNPFNENIAIVYKEEYCAAQHLVKRINKEYGANLIQDEIGIVALHIHAARKNEDISVSRRKTNLYQETLEKIYERMDLHPSKDSLAHQRLLLHICFAYERIFKNEQIGNDILDIILTKYHKDFEILRDVLNSIEKNNKIKIPDSEVGYLVLHVNRIKKECMKM